MDPSCMQKCCFLTLRLVAAETPSHWEALSDVSTRMSLTVGGLRLDAAVVAPLMPSASDSMASTQKDGGIEAWSKQVICI